MVLNLHVTKITHPNWFRSRGVDPTFFQMYGNQGVNPSLFAKNIWELRGVAPQNEACMREMYSL